MIHKNLANDILKLVTAKTSSVSRTANTACYLALFKGDPADGGTELSGDGYDRVLANAPAASQYTSIWGEVADGVVTNAKAFMFPKATAPWEADYFGVYLGTELVASDQLTDPDIEPDSDGNYTPKTLNVATGEVAVFDIGKLVLRFK